MPVLPNKAKELEEKLRRLRERGDDGVVTLLAYLQIKQQGYYRESVHNDALEARERARAMALAFDAIIKDLSLDSMERVKSHRIGG